MQSGQFLLLPAAHQLNHISGPRNQILLLAQRKHVVYPHYSLGFNTFENPNGSKSKIGALVWRHLSLVGCYALSDIFRFLCEFYLVLTLLLSKCQQASTCSICNLVASYFCMGKMPKSYLWFQYHKQ